MFISSFCTGPVLVAPSAVAVAIVESIAYHWFENHPNCHHPCHLSIVNCCHLRDRPPLSGTCTCSRPTPRCNLSQKPPHLHRSLQLLRSTVTFAATKSGFLPLLMKHPLSPGPHLDNSPAVMSLQEDSSSSLLHW